VSDCIFCKIIEGEVPAAVLLDTKKLMAFLDVNPVNPGHSLVVPKRHVERLPQLSQDELHSCIFAAQRVGRAVMDATDSPGLNLLQNNHECAGQHVPHVHFHVIPRKPDDGFSLGWRQGEYGEGELEDMQETISALL
jgi:histidine triad (HIT) family protein